MVPHLVRQPGAQPTALVSFLAPGRMTAPSPLLKSSNGREMLLLSVHLQ